MTGDQESAHALAAALIAARAPDTFMALWGAQPPRIQGYAVRVIAARVARAVPDGIHHRAYRTPDPELDAALCGVVEAVRHRLPGRGALTASTLRRLGERSHTAPWRLCEILITATR